MIARQEYLENLSSVFEITRTVVDLTYHLYLHQKKFRSFYIS